MVRDALQSNALPESFAEETLAQAVTRAAELNKEHHFDEAESLLRDVLGKAPDHPAALKELNRTLMRGWVYGKARWDRLPELVEHGRAILASGSDEEYVYRQIAETLLAIPAMQEAIEFIEKWIADKDANLERLGKLAWARGCVAEYDEAERLWQQARALLLEQPAAPLCEPLGERRLLGRVTRASRVQAHLPREAAAHRPHLRPTALFSWMVKKRPPGSTEPGG